MQNLEPALYSPSSLFQLWITQWQLGILDPKEASLILNTVLVHLRTREADDPLWKFLAQFFASLADSGTSLLRDGAEPEQLLQRVCSLQPQQAKSLLEYLSRRYAFDRDDVQFWTSVRQAIELHGGTPCEISSPDMC